MYPSPNPASLRLISGATGLASCQSSPKEFTLIHVLAFITTKPGRRNEVLEAFRANVPAVHAEDGCIEYGASIDAQDVGPFQTQVGPDTFVVVEKWTSVEALKAHAGSSHMAAYGARTKDLLASRVIHVLSPT
jgi:quinol monooxygenase YgiN